MPAKRYTLFLILLAYAADAPAQLQESSGTVVATMDAEGYTYAQIEIHGSNVWFAAPAVELKIGDQVAAPAGMPMKDFHSKTLDRTFDMIYFVDAITAAVAPDNGSVLPAGHPPIQPAACPAPSAACFDFSGIERPEGAKTIAEIQSGKRECLAPSPHTTKHAGPHLAVRKAPTDIKPDSASETIVP
jgi:hypothetical protein